MQNFMSMCSLIEYSNNYSKPSGSLWQYYIDEPALDNNDNIASFLVMVHRLNIK